MNRKTINLQIYVDVEQSEKRKALIIHWETPDKSVGGQLDLTDLFTLFMEWQKKNRIRID